MIAPHDSGAGHLAQFVADLGDRDYVNQWAIPRGQFVCPACIGGQDDPGTAIGGTGLTRTVQTAAIFSGDAG